MGRTTRFIFMLVLVFSGAPVLAADAEHFPFPENLRPAVEFWTQVYTEVDTSSGFLHDPENLAVIYARVDRSTEEVNEVRRYIAADLRVLASGKREGLTASQQHILSLWPEGVSNQRLARAADNVRWQLGQSDRFLAGMRRSGAYRAHIEDVVLSKGMPIELAVLPHVESSFHPGAYSSAAATGMWQFIRSTAQRFMQVDYVVDERLDPYSATYGAMDLLQYNYNALGTWPLALTAYNHGANGMARAVAETGTDDIGRIIAEYRGPRFGFASRNFYPQFLAVLEVESRLEEFFGELELDPPQEFVEMEMTAYVDARTIAETLNVSLDELRRTNPALQPSVWSGTKRIPRGYRLKLDRAAWSGDLLASLGQIPVQQRFNEQIPDVSYTVRSGDSLSVIAARYNTTISELVAINQLRDRNRIRVGQVLLLPQQEGAQTLLASNTSSTANSQDIPDNGRYEVRRGDSLSLIAERFRLNQDRLMAINNLNERDVIYPGQTLVLTGEEQVQPVLLASNPVSEPTIRQELEELEEAEEVAEVEDQAATVAGLAGLQQSTIVLEQLDIDSASPALPLNDLMQAIEEEEQLAQDLSTDPADYSVASNDTIEIQAAETLGHYADWLGIRAWDLRRLNNMNFSDPVIIGSRLKLSFSEVDKGTFERRRREYHRDLQQAYFEQWRIRGTEKYTIRNRDLLATLARRRSVPMWLFQQYNPDVDAHRISIGQEVVFPIVEPVTL